MLPLLTVQNLGAFILNWHLFSSSPLGNCKNAKNAAFLTRNPYRLGSFQLGAQNMSKIGSFLENTVFYAIKLNHRVLHNFPGARTLICLFSCSLVLICTKTVELSSGILFREKKHGAPNSKCSASLRFKRLCVKHLVFYAIKLCWKS